MNIPHDDVRVDYSPTKLERVSACIALVGRPKVSIQWAVRTMESQFPINSERSVFCYPHENLDVSRNLTLDRWLNAPKALRSEWIALYAGEDIVRWDALPHMIKDGAPVARVGHKSYVLRRSAVGDPPWFVDGKWTGDEPVVRDDLTIADETFRQGPLEIESEKSASQMIVIGVPSLGYTSLLWSAAMIQLAAPMAGSAALMCAIGYEVGEARQHIVTSVLNADPRPEYLLFVGDDNLPPPQGLRLLLETMQDRKAKAVGGLYYLKSSPPDLPLLWRNGNAGSLVPGRDFQMGDVIEVDGTGLDFVLFKTEALAAIEGLKFHTMVKFIKGHGMVTQTEDAFFYDKFKKVHGHGPLVDTRCRVGHYDHHHGGVY